MSWQGAFQLLSKARDQIPQFLGLDLFDGLIEQEPFAQPLPSFRPVGKLGFN